MTLVAEEVVTGNASWSNMDSVDLHLDLEKRRWFFSLELPAGISQASAPQLVDLYLREAMEQAENKNTSPQKQTVKNRSKSTDEVQQAKKAFHTPQKSLPAKPETEKLEADTEELCASSEELK